MKLGVGVLDMVIVRWVMTGAVIVAAVGVIAVLKCVDWCIPDER